MLSFVEFSTFHYIVAPLLRHFIVLETHLTDERMKLENTHSKGNGVPLIYQLNPSSINVDATELITGFLPNCQLT